MAKHQVIHINLGQPERIKYVVHLVEEGEITGEWVASFKDETVAKIFAEIQNSNPTVFGDSPERKKREEYRAALEIAKAELDALWSFYGQNLEVHNWHLNGAGEPLDNFFNDNNHEARAAIKKALETK